MAKKPIVYIAPILLFVIFVGFGDKILPQPLSGASLKTRTTINKFLLGLFPKKEISNPNEKREKEIEKWENQN